MARFRDLRTAIRGAGLWHLAKETWRKTNADDLFTLAAALAYSWLFAFFPFLIFLLTLAPYLPRHAKTNGREIISATIARAMPRDAANTLLGSLNSVLNQPRAGLLSIGLVVTLWVASGGVSTTMSALDRAFEAAPRPFYIQRPLAIVLTILMVVLTLLVLLLAPVGTALLHYAAASSHMSRPALLALNLSRHVLALALLFCVLAVLYRFGTTAPQRLSFLSPGAIFTVLVWVVLGIGLRIYVNDFGSYEKMYGAVGGVAIVLLLFYVDGLVLLMGAEINSAIDRALRDAKAREAPASGNHATVTPRAGGSS